MIQQKNYELIEIKTATQKLLREEEIRQIMLPGTLNFLSISTFSTKLIQKRQSNKNKREYVSQEIYRV